NLRYAKLSNIGNPELSWEKIGQTKFGVEFGSKSGRIGGNIEYWRKKGVDLIGTTTFPPSSGVVNYRGNFSSMKGQGWDFSINTVNSKGQIRWSSNALLSFAKDKVTRYDITHTNQQILVADGLNGRGVIPIEGRPVFSVYSLPFAGLDAENGDPLGYLGEIGRAHV